MKKILLTSVLLFFGLHLVAQEKAQTYTSELGKFSMISYGEVTEDVKEDKASTIYRAAYRHNEMLFAISSSLQENKPNKVSDLLNASVITFKTALKGTVVEQKKIKENNLNGIYASLTMSNDVKVEYKVFSKGLYLYQVMVFAKKDKYKNEVAEAFFKSFAITK
ncbi:hypothetical protein [Polaribacter uvawellassae]|uniref:hypothetical protein n=1 Tax=Polaribacter uvawellassae TaxID=3133495 RepID=UPI00321B638C